MVRSYQIPYDVTQSKILIYGQLTGKWLSRQNNKCGFVIELLYITQSLSLLGYNNQTILLHYKCLKSKKKADNKSQSVWRKGRHFLSLYNPTCYGNRRRMLFSGPVTARCHSSRVDRADVIRMGVPGLPWRLSVSTIRVFWLSRYTKTEHKPCKTSSLEWLQRGEGDNNGIRINIQPKQMALSVLVCTHIFSKTPPSLTPSALFFFFFFLPNAQHTHAAEGTFYRGVSPWREVQVNVSVWFFSIRQIELVDKCAHAKHTDTHENYTSMMSWIFNQRAWDNVSGSQTQRNDE